MLKGKMRKLMRMGKIGSAAAGRAGRILRKSLILK
jgi:hypothetical protein